ncbi:hypothetical protein [Leptotrichia massiliensis]|uniref:hypothetical protein n=1 Tax=Leptotrichia massiliensis TaxID=1852388 RepID=UPI0008DB11C2|nr:hypothetical protein [Leptotrichia massiliensis]
MYKKNISIKFFMLILSILMFISCYGKTKVLTIYTNPLTKSYTSLGKGKLLLARRNDFDREIKFVAKVDGVTVEHNYVEWNDSYFYPIETGFIIKLKKNVVYSFMGIVPEGIPEARLIISYKGEQKVVMIDWGLQTGENGENLDYYDVYF